MSILDIVYYILIMPLKMFFEILYMAANKVLQNPGMSIIALSLAMNLLVLPLYIRADAMQEEEKNIESLLRRGVNHIKKTFSGDEKMMMLQTYYRQNNYKPTYVFKNSISLLLEIPFFIAAYQFLSHLSIIQGVSFGVIRDLGAADGLINIHGTAINLLPIIMTSVNLISCIIFTKGHPLKTKLQLYAMALFFLVFLYDSPAGLVFYWTLNNLFSLGKTIVYKVIEYIRKKKSSKASVSQPEKVSIEKKVNKPNRKFFVLAGIFLSVLVGILIPSATINASPKEFVDIYFYLNPMWYIVSSFCIAAGAFVVWFGVFYWLASERVKPVFEAAMLGFCGVAIIDYMIFENHFGVLNSSLRYEESMEFGSGQMLLNLLLCVIAFLIFMFIYHLAAKFSASLVAVLTLAVAGMCIYNIVCINPSGLKVNAKEESIQFNLSRTGNNVVVIMLDRAMGEYIPYLFNEKPELKESYDGFTYYSNVISYGAYTNIASPALFGGYEYTPVENNKRDSLSLAEKQNEALKVMPVLFSQNGYDVTVCDPVYAGYEWIPDLSIYDAYPEIDAYITKGYFSDLESRKFAILANKQNFFCYSMMRVAPIAIRKLIYSDGTYNHDTYLEGNHSQYWFSEFASVGIDGQFMDTYLVLDNLAEMTEIVDENIDTFMMMDNDTTHDPNLVQTPDYIASEVVDNTEYFALHRDDYVVDGKQLYFDNFFQYLHYNGNGAAICRIAEWLDYLKAEGVYDNTRIILVADHGKCLGQIEDCKFNESADENDTYEQFFPLLMVKDFGATGFTMDDTFMTNADVPTIATNGLIDNPVNPFTGNVISSEAKNGPQYVSASTELDVKTNRGNQFIPGKWYKVEGNMRDKDNWILLDGEGYFPLD